MRPHIRLTGFVAVLAASLYGLCADPALAETSWAETKCARYNRAWTDLVRRRGTAGLGPDFIARHAAFLRSGCTSTDPICPAGADEQAVANALTIAAMTAGTASSFVPFRCPANQGGRMQAP